MLCEICYTVFQGCEESGDYDCPKCSMGFSHPHIPEKVYESVLTKQDFARRYKLGEFGNASPTFNTPDELRSCNEHSERFHLRNRVTPMGATYYDLDYFEALKKWIRVGNPDDWYVSMMAPTQDTIIQGELTYDGAWSELQLRYTTVKKPMRDALRQKELHLGRESHIRLLLQSVMCVNSYEWLWELFRRYPEHSIEFSTYSRPWGTLSPLFNTVFWEVRKY